MVYRGHVRNGRIELNEPVALPEGAEVELTVVDNGSGSPLRHSIDEVLRAIADSVPETEWDKLPPDLTDRLDHYLYGTPKP